ncbi:hypothetical protein PR202_gb01223 [Eleusine coracana subsp. coracana]|uniref:Protein NRT1/ PTR FAMILY 3.1 n=1 Tax=Eleusine coracana subsp. coracana TaxID=191504 RepID=A0AAV5DW17_ELECO|nr:hypothetical protein PR202_gb01223 [Eleusine coracana subsp. coracana]
MASAAAPVDEDVSPKETKQGGFRTMPCHLPLVEASNLLTNFNGTAAFTPVLGAIIADSFSGRYWAIAGGGALYLLGMLGLVVSALAPALRPTPCAAAITTPCERANGRAARHALPAAAPHGAGVRWHPARLLQVVVAAVKKRKEAVPEDAALLYQNKELDAPIAADGRLLHTDQLRQVPFLDRAAVLTADDVVAADSGQPDLWRLSTVHRVEELKSIARMLPLWAASITLIAAASHNFTFAIQQSRSMDRRLTPHFTIPPASMIIFTTLTMLVSLALYDRAFVPLARRVTGLKSGITYFQRMGAGFAVSVLGVAAGALVEARRRRVAADHGLVDDPNATVPMSVFWLVPQYALHGVSDALSTVGHMEFLYDQSPESMRSSAAALFWVAGSIGNYLGTVLVTVVQSATKGAWLQDNINRWRLDYYYWLVTFLLVLNLVYYIVCFHFYTVKIFEVDNAGDDVQRRGDGCEAVPESDKHAGSRN